MRVGGEVGWAGPLDPEACRRLACDGAVTRVLVTRQPPGHHHRGTTPTARYHPAPPTQAARHHPNPTTRAGPTG